MPKKQLNDFNKLINYEIKMDKHYFKRRADYFEQVLKLQNKNIKILDFGCGTGKFLQVSRNAGYDNVIGFDFSKTLVKMANKDNRGSIVMADGKYLPIKSNTINFVLMADVIEHLDNYNSSLMEIHRTLRKNGLLLITYPNPNIVPLLNLLSSLGLKVKTKENKIPLKELKISLSSLFKIEDFRTIILASKLPQIILNLLEKFETKLPYCIINQIGFTHILLFRKK